MELFLAILLEHHLHVILKVEAKIKGNMGKKFSQVVSRHALDDGV